MTVAEQLVRSSEVVSFYRRLKKKRMSSIGGVRQSLSDIQTYENSKNSNSLGRIEKVIRLWSDFQQKQTLLNRKDGHLFNPLFLMSIGETKHSELLGYLLKPWEAHGYGDVFLVSFLHMLGVAEPERGKWSVTVEKGRIDLLLMRDDPKSVVIIENKSNNAVDQQNQLYRYWHRVIHQNCHIPFADYESEAVRAHFKIIYMPSGVHKEPERHSLRCPEYLRDSDSSLPHDLPLEYELKDYNEDVAQWLESIVELVEPSNVRLRTYLQFYTELCKSL